MEFKKYLQKKLLQQLNSGLDIIWLFGYITKYDKGDCHNEKQDRTPT